jgi:hypothetical protein
MPALELNDTEKAALAAPPSAQIEKHALAAGTSHEGAAGHPRQTGPAGSSARTVPGTLAGMVGC